MAPKPRDGNKKFARTVTIFSAVLSDEEEKNAEKMEETFSSVTVFLVDMPQTGSAEVIYLQLLLINVDLV